MFMEGCENLSIDNQQKIFERKQQIKVNGRNFDFHANDRIFNLDKMQDTIEPLNSRTNKNFYQGSSCFTCSKTLDKHA